MKIKKINPKIKYLYHYTLKENLDKILKDKKIKSSDDYIFFTGNLKDSISSFENEIMAPNKLYIDLDGNLKRRKKVERSKYCILKIPYINDNNFYSFTFDNQNENSIYNISITHKGEYDFNKASILEIPDKKYNLLNKTAISIIAAMVFFPYNVFAASWLDNNNYDINWYVPGQVSYNIANEKEFAGLAYLVNKENMTFDNIIINLEDDIDLTENTWEVIKDIFNGNICGGHRIILNYLDKDLLSNKKYEMLDYLYKVKVDTNTTENVKISSPYTVANLKSKINVRYVFFKNEELQDDTKLTSLNLDESELIETFRYNYKYIENYKGEKFPFKFESGDSIENVKEAYSLKTKIPKEKLVLKFQDKILDDGRTLADYNIQPRDSLFAYVNISLKANLNGSGTYELSKTNALSGDEVVLKLIPDLGKEITSVLINGQEQKDLIINNELKIRCGEENIEIKIIYNEKTTINEIENPKTNDNILLYVLTFIISSIAIVKKLYKKI